MAVYFIQRLSDGAIKIGFTETAYERFKKLKREIREPVKVLCILEGDMSSEKSYHARFHECRIEGEWFAQGGELVEFIRSMQNTASDIKSKEFKPKTITIQVTKRNRDRLAALAGHDNSLDEVVSRLLDAAEGGKP